MHNKIAIVFCLFSAFGWSQPGGLNTYNFLDLPTNARTLALGGHFIGIRDADLNLSLCNPALLNKEQHHQLAFNNALLPGRAHLGSLVYGRTLNNDIQALAALRFLNYGQMVMRDETGQEIGTFNPGDFDLVVGFSKPMTPKWNIGLQTHFLYSQIDIYKSIALALDFGASYVNEDKDLTAAFLVRNAGIEIKPYVKKNRYPLPLDLQASLSKKLAHAPFRFTLLGHHLNRWDITYFDPNTPPSIDAISGDTVAVKSPNFVEKAAHHLTYQLEILLTKNFHIRTAFDYHDRRMMRLEQRPGLSGFSFGVGMWFKRFSIDYGLGVISAAGTQHMLSLRTPLSAWKR